MDPLVAVTTLDIAHSLTCLITELLRWDLEGSVARKLNAIGKPIERRYFPTVELDLTRVNLRNQKLLFNLEGVLRLRRYTTIAVGRRCRHSNDNLAL